MLPQTPSQMVRGHPSPCFLPRSRRIQNEVVIGPRDNGFPGPIVALDGPEHSTICRHVSLYTHKRITDCSRGVYDSALYKSTFTYFFLAGTAENLYHLYYSFRQQITSFLALKHNGPKQFLLPARREQS